MIVIFQIDRQYGEECMKNNTEATKKYMVLLVDRKRAIMFTFLDGKAKNKKMLVDGQVPQRVKVDEESFYGRTDKIARHIEDHLHRHLTLIGNAAHTYWEKGKFDGIVVGTHRPLFTKITHHLPSSLNQHLIGKIVIDFKTPFGQILKKVQLFVEKTEQESDIKDYEKFFTHH